MTKKHEQLRELLAKKFRALANPARLEILELLKKESCICGEIVDVLPLAQATVSQHLKVLKDAGFIFGEESGTKVCYQLDKYALREFKDLVSAL